MIQISIIYCFIIIFIVISIVLVSSVCIHQESNNNERNDSNKINNQKSISFEEMCKIIRERHSQPNDRIIGVDIPRFSNKLTIISETQIIKGNEIEEKYHNQNYKMENTTKEMISELIRLIENEEMAQQFIDKFDEMYEYMKNNKSGDCGSHFIRLVPLVFPETSLIKSVLKTFTQTLFITTVDYFTEFKIAHPFADQSNGWIIEVKIDSNEIVIKHIKKQISREENEFRFEWYLIYHVDKQSYHITTIELNIHDVEFLNYPEKKQNDFMKFVNKLNKIE